MHVVEELFDRLREHEATPHQRSALILHEHARTHHFEQSRTNRSFVGNDAGLVDPIHPTRFEAVAHAQHSWDGEPPDVGVEHPNHMAV